MTRDKKTIADLQEQVRGLEEELAMIVESMRLCRFCKYLDADCAPYSKACRAEWRGKE